MCLAETGSIGAIIKHLRSMNITALQVNFGKQV